MASIEFIWDLEDDPKGNVRHVLRNDVTPDEVEEVLRNRRNSTIFSRETGTLLTFGWTETGKHLAVLWENVYDDSKTIYPITAYPAPPPKSRRHGRG